MKSESTIKNLHAGHLRKLFQHDQISKDEFTSFIQIINLPIREIDIDYFSNLYEKFKSLLKLYELEKLIFDNLLSPFYIDKMQSLKNEYELYILLNKTNIQYVSQLEIGIQSHFNSFLNDPNNNTISSSPSISFQLKLLKRSNDNLKDIEEMIQSEHEKRSSIFNTHVVIIVEYKKYLSSLYDIKKQSEEYQEKIKSLILNSSINPLQNSLDELDLENINIGCLMDCFNINTNNFVTELENHPTQISLEDIEKYTKVFHHQMMEFQKTLELDDVENGEAILKNSIQIYQRMIKLINSIKSS